MKLKLVSAACLALCSFGSFAATASSCPATPTAADLVNKCAPEVTFYIGGASAQAGALTTALLTPGVIFDESKPFAKVRDVAQTISGSGSATAVNAGVKDGNTIAFVGYGAAGTGTAAGKRVAVIYNKANGSFAGVNQLLNPKAALAENTTLVLTTLTEQKGAGKAVACTTSALAADTVAAVAGTKLGYSTYECASEAAFSTGWGADKAKAMSLALADVRPSEATPGVVAKWKASAFPAVTTGMQGFGVIVSPNLYTALIKKEVAAGHLAASCLTSEDVTSAVQVITAACQPNLPSAAYTSLITGKTTTAADFLGDSTDTNLIVLARRTDSSGTQAASNIFFANQAAYNAKTPTTDNAPDVIKGNPADPTASVSYGDVRVFEKTATGDVITAVKAPAAGSYAIGVVSLENYYSMTKASSKLGGALYVKIDGISPNLTVDGSGNTVVDGKDRAGIIAGYPFAFEMQAIQSAKLAEPYATIAGKIVTALKDPAGNLAGIAYIGSTDTTRNTPFTRLNSNYAPLSK